MDAQSIVPLVESRTRTAAGRRADLRGSDPGTEDRAGCCSLPTRASASYDTTGRAAAYQPSQTAASKARWRMAAAGAHERVSTAAGGERVALQVTGTVDDR